MHINRINKGVIKKVLSILLVSTILIGGIVIGFNQRKINKLEDELYKKQQYEQMTSDYTESQLNTKSIELEFNKLNDYKIFDGKININHKYEYSRDAFLGLKKEGVLVGTANVGYQYDVRLSNADIRVNGDTIEITIDKPILNKSTVHIIDNSILIDEDESKDNILMNQEDGKSIMKHWSNSLSIRAKDEIENYYNDEDMQDKLEGYAKVEVKNLVESLGYDKVRVNIK